jgi:hypothetical protein
MADDPDLFRVAQRFSRPLVYMIVCSLILVATAVYASSENISPKKEHTPAGAVDYIQQQKLVGNIYNTFEFGGYLIFRGIKTFIDGRIDQLFLGGFMDRVTRAQLQGNFPDLLKEYNISLVLVAPGSSETRQIERLPGWRKAYSDAVSIVYVRDP